MKVVIIHLQLLNESPFAKWRYKIKFILEDRTLKIVYWYTLQQP